ncbi:MAG: hypothetical protein F2840_16385 [Actinobacteria bacterium]|uniref:Unannotated protein n=1 Tax=freshwater metagenome TaxID=449393 RepID=A0A6J7LRT8_9ZZZZ|nr:hypothetical protein [Actinomycetota bacterium]
MTALEWLVAYVSACGSRCSGRNWQCPAHADGSPSLSLSEGNDGAVLVHCFAGCTVHQVMHALGLDLGRLFEPHVYSPESVLGWQLRKPTFAAFSPSGGSSGSKRSGRPITTVHHVYVPDAVRLERTRYAGGGKKCCWEVKDGRDWHYAAGLDLASLPLYEQRQMLMGASAGEPVVVCESESSVDAMLKAGIYATTWAGGAASPQLHTLKEALAGARVVLIPDNDPPGLKCGEAIADALRGVCDLATIIPDPGQDARDLLEKSEPRLFLKVLEGAR